MLAAEFAMFFKFDTVRVILLVLAGIIVPLFAFSASQHYFRSIGGSHIAAPPVI
jgi:hypothetical protein